MQLTHAGGSIETCQWNCTKHIFNIKCSYYVYVGKTRKWKNMYKFFCKKMLYSQEIHSFDDSRYPGSLPGQK